MLIQRLETWSVSGSGEKKIKLINNLTGDRVVSVMYINPLSDCEITVTGYVSEDDATGVALKSVDIANLSKCDTIENAGNYMLIVEPYYKVKLEVDGTADIIIKALN